MSVIIGYLSKLDQGKTYLLNPTIFDYCEIEYNPRKIVYGVPDFDDKYVFTEQLEGSDVDDLLIILDGSNNYNLNELKSEIENIQSTRSEMSQGAFWDDRINLLRLKLKYHKVIFVGNIRKAILAIKEDNSGIIIKE